MKMKMRFDKRIIGVFLLGMILSLYPLKANAYNWGGGWPGNGGGGIGNATCNYLNQYGTLLSEKYGTKISYDGDNNRLVLKLVTKSYNTALRGMMDKIKFKIDGIRVYDTTNRTSDDDPGMLLGEYISDRDFYAIENIFGINVITDRLSIEHKIQMKGYSSSAPLRYELILFPDGFSDPEILKNCPNVEAFYIKLIVEVGAKKPDVDLVPPVIEDPSPVHVGTIKCGEYKTKYNPVSFEYQYCDLKEKAENSNATTYISYSEDKNTYAKYIGSNSPLTYKCNPFDFVSNDASSDTYYKNVNYLHGQIINEVTRKYHYSYGCKAKDVTVGCKVKCDEYVSVEYGPPIAASGGMCFEYKVKVTSRVNCEMSAPPPLPNGKEKLCTPTPACEHGEGGWIGRAAGPDDDFDACIDACDGGKYSDSCTVKCYNKVYGLDEATAQANAFTANYSVVADKLKEYNNNTRDRDTSCDYQGEYQCKNGVITWTSTGCKNGYLGLGRYYHGLAGFKHGCVKTTAEGGGIASLCGCSATCVWTGCHGDVYLNPDDYQKDYENNMKVYNELKSKCEGYAKCSTTQSEFTISASYTAKGDSKETTIHYPYTSTTDNPNTKATIKYGTNSISCSPSIDQETSIFLSTNGCYNCNKGSNGTGTGTTTDSSVTWYQTEWSFPGTWSDLKSGNISYTPKPGWLKFDKKFCLPRQIEDVNQDWWNASYLSKSSGMSFSYNTPTTEKRECNIISCPAPSEVFKQSDVGNITYNIEAGTRKFGLFEWNVDIKCFYGLNSNFPYNSKGKIICATDCPNAGSPLGTTGVSIRPVDLANLFPAANGESLSNPATTGRAAGFNWTEFANTAKKDQNYTSDPKNYRTWVQSVKYDVYADEYLDYDIYLYKEDIAKLKESNKQIKNFNKSPLTSSVDSVTHYRSKLFRDGAILKEFHAPSEEALRCNNIKNYSSNECFVGEVK